MILCVQSFILASWDNSQKEGISLSIEANVPANLGIEQAELASLLANAVGNAYEACMVLPKDGERYIKVEAHYNGKCLAVGIPNTVRRFSGAYTFSAKDGLFFFEICS